MKKENIIKGIINQTKTIITMLIFNLISFILFALAELKENPIIFIACMIAFIIIYSIIWSKFLKKYLLKSIELSKISTITYIIIFLLFIVINLCICWLGALYKKDFFTNIDHALIFIIIIHPAYILLYSTITSIIAYKNNIKK